MGMEGEVLGKAGNPMVEAAEVEGTCGGWSMNCVRLRAAGVDGRGASGRGTGIGGA